MRTYYYIPGSVLGSLQAKMNTSWSWKGFLPGGGSDSPHIIASEYDKCRGQVNTRPHRIIEQGTTKMRSWATWTALSAKAFTS